MIQLLENLLGNHMMVIVLDILYVLLCNLFIALQLLKINCRDVRVTGCAVFTAVMTAVLSIPNYFVLFSFRQLFFPDGIPPLIRILLITFFSYRNPIWLAVYFIAARKILGLPKRNVASSALLVFLFSELFALISDGAEFIYLPFSDHLSPFAGFSVAHIILITCLILVNVFFVKYIDRNTHRLKMLFEVGNEGKKHIGLMNFLLACSLWSVMAVGVSLATVNTLTVKGYFMAIMTVFILVLIALTFRIKLNNVALYQNALRNNTLFETIDDFRGIRHDMNNILQVYDGFIQTGNYEALNAFHGKLFNKTAELNERLDLHLCLKDSPALYGLFLSMYELAQASNVSFDVKDIPLFKQIDIPDFDLCRLLSNLIKNAIESAASAPAPEVRISIGRGLRGEVIVSVSNTVSEKVDIPHMFKTGFSTKNGHSGRGLNEVNKILSKYYGCTITPAYDAPHFVMYVHLPYKTSAAHDKEVSHL